MKISTSLKLCILFATLGLHSCQKDDLEINRTTAEFNKPYKLGFNDVSYLSSGDKSIQVTIMSISDLRCLKEQECENEGSASVRLNISNLKNTTGETILSISSSHAVDSTIININGVNYHIQLIEVTSGFNNKPNTGPVATIIVTPMSKGDVVKTFE
jgi:hypothetical protein